MLPTLQEVPVPAGKSHGQPRNSSRLNHSVFLSHIYPRLLCIRASYPLLQHNSPRRAHSAPCQVGTHRPPKLIPPFQHEASSGELPAHRAQSWWARRPRRCRPAAGGEEGSAAEPPAAAARRRPRAAAAPPRHRRCRLPSPPAVKHPSTCKGQHRGTSTPIFWQV